MALGEGVRSQGQESENGGVEVFSGSTPDPSRKINESQHPTFPPTITVTARPGVPSRRTAEFLLFDRTSLSRRSSARRGR